MAGWGGLLSGLPGKDESWLLSHHRLTGGDLEGVASGLTFPSVK